MGSAVVLASGNARQAAQRDARQGLAGQVTWYLRWMLLRAHLAVCWHGVDASQVTGPVPGRRY
jgi:hypothetical protein